jgi:hypothetical protein
MSRYQAITMPEEVWRTDCCSDIVKLYILATEVLFSSALILTSDHNQDGVLIPSYNSCIPPRLSYNPDKALTVILQNQRKMRQTKNVSWYQQLLWQGRHARRNCCSLIVKWFILTTDVLVIPALILTSEHNQNVFLTPDCHPHLYVLHDYCHFTESEDNASKCVLISGN